MWQVKILSPSSYSFPFSISVSSSTSSISTPGWGKGPVWQAWIQWTWEHWAFHSAQTSSLQVEQTLGHQDILTVPAVQSISRLCFFSQGSPSIRSSFPMQVTTNTAHL